MKNLLTLMFSLMAFKLAAAEVTPIQTGPLSFALPKADGGAFPLAPLRGKVVMLVNTASRCGYTKQYDDLQKLYEEFEARGLVIVGVPSNDFGGQEPGTNEEIQAFCSSRFHVTFPVVAKISVIGTSQHPLYQWLTQQSPFPGAISWNFNKFLIGRDGAVVARWPSKVTPKDEVLRNQVKLALEAPAP